MPQDGLDAFDRAVLLLAEAPQGCGLRVHENADVLTADVLTVLNIKGYIEWRFWCNGEHGPQIYNQRWDPGLIDWGDALSVYRGDSSPEIRLLYKGTARAAELRVRPDKPKSWLARLFESVAAQFIAGILVIAVVGIIIYNWPWIKAFLG